MTRDIANEGGPATPASTISVALLLTTFGILGAIVTTTAVAVRSFAEIEARLGSIEGALHKLSNDPWNGRDMIRWASRLRELNPSVVVPDPILDMK